MVALTILLGALGCQPESDLLVFHAASLSRPLAELKAAYEAQHSRVRIVLEPSASQTAARKVAELQRPADLVLAADPEVLTRILVPAHAERAVTLATTRLVLAYGPHSRFSEELSPTRWPEILQRQGVRLGLANADTAPIGYRTLLVWELAGRHFNLPGLPAALRAHVDASHLAADETELWGLLATRSVDYAFLYRSTAFDHRLPFIELGADVDLGDPAKQEAYAAVSVPVVMKVGEPPVQVVGAPIAFAYTLLRNAPNPRLAREFLAFLHAPAAEVMWRRSGFEPVAMRPE